MTSSKKTKEKNINGEFEHFPYSTVCCFKNQIGIARLEASDKENDFVGEFFAYTKALRKHTKKILNERKAVLEELNHLRSFYNVKPSLKETESNSFRYITDKIKDQEEIIEALKQTLKNLDTEAKFYSSKLN